MIDRTGFNNFILAKFVGISDLIKYPQLFSWMSLSTGSHCLDIQRASPSDPHWLVMQRKIEVKIIEGWISKYYTDLLEVKDQTPF
jgi:hypothetical protein